MFVFVFSCEGWGGQHACYGERNNAGVIACIPARDVRIGDNVCDVFICFSGKERIVTWSELYHQQECVAIRS